MMPRLMLINQPSIDLKTFVELVGQDAVNEVDRKQIQPVAKFAELVDESLSEDIDAYAHLYLAFYIEMPAELEVEFRMYPYINLFRFTMRLEKFMSQGIMSGAFDQWMGFMKWASRRESSKYLRAYSNQLFRLVSHHKFFQSLQSSEMPDKTFCLE